MRRCRVLAVTGGHRFDLDAFRAMLDAVCVTADDGRHWTWAHAVQPLAQRWLDGDAPFDAVLCHDIPGLHLKRGEPPRRIDPEPWVPVALAEMFERGTGVVVLHHALAGWPSWDGWADAVGGRFLYAPGPLHGAPWPSSGTRIDTYTARVLAADHPVCAGVDDFVLTDELYCCPVFEDRVVPLLGTDADTAPGRFVSTYEHVLVGEEAAPRCVGHPPASSLIAWATSAGNSPVVVLQPGDNAETFALPPYRRLLGNALAWVASAEARAWAASRRLD
jgi:type 1 glutamine amidotransferase